MAELIRVMATMENMKAIIEWQTAGFVHPLTCGKDSSHPDLLPTVDDHKFLSLVCTAVGCCWKQDFIPECCVSNPKQPHWEETKKALRG